MTPILCYFILCYFILFYRYPETLNGIDPHLTEFMQPDKHSSPSDPSPGPNLGLSCSRLSLSPSGREFTSPGSSLHLSCSYLSPSGREFTEYEYGLNYSTGAAHILNMEISLKKTTTSTCKKYKETKMKEIIRSVCALLNTEGGDLVLNLNEKSTQDTMFSFIRMIEQRLAEIIGNVIMVSNTNFEIIDQKIILRVKKSSLLILTNYNLYLPTQTQVIPVQPNAQIEIVKEFITCDGERILHGVKIGSHARRFVKDRNCQLKENKEIQLKNLKAGSSKCVTLGDRMKSNKLPCYVSAFANHHGGHIYYGIKDDGTVEGEVITDKDHDEITKKVGKTIDKMIWPQKPEKGKHWDIFFEPVLDINSRAIPSTYVIVVFVASCLGGVFVEEPESYEISVDGKVEKMRFSCHPLSAIPCRKPEIPPLVQRCSWSSPRNKKLYGYVNEQLMMEINNGNWDEFTRKCKIFVRECSESVVRMAVLSKQVTAYYRRGQFSKAAEVLQQYKRSVSSCQDTLIFEVIGLYLEAALERCQGNYETGYEILRAALSKLEQISSGLVTASFYSLIATFLGIIDCQQISDSTSSSHDGKLPDEVFSMKALEHLATLSRTSDMRADVEEKAHINLAIHYLSFSLSGDLVVSRPVDKACLATANSHLSAISHLVCGGDGALSRFREIQFHSTLAILYYRRCQVDALELCGKRNRHLLQVAFDYSKKAEVLARESQFYEMIKFSQKCMSHCTEELVRMPPKLLEEFRRVKEMSLDNTSESSGIE